MQENHIVPKELFEVLAQASAASGTDQVMILRTNDSPQLQAVLSYTFDDNKTFDISDDFSYVPSPEWSAPTSIRRAYKDLVHCDIESNLTQSHRERIFKSILEGIHPKDAEVLMSMLNKDAPLNITSEIVLEAFPNLF